jgi:hypothetical protein
MNPAILEIASLAVQCNTNSRGTPLESGKDSAGFIRLIQQSMAVHEGNSVHHAKIDAQGESMKEGDQLYLESLRRALLAKGKPLQDASLSTTDLPLVRKLLSQCGFSDEDINTFLQELLRENPSGHINLAEFFRKVVELDLANRERHQDMILEPAAIPYLESALRNCGLTPEQLDRAFSAARAEEGGLNLHRLATELKDVSAKMGAQGENLPNKLKLDQFVEALEGLMNRVSVGKRGASDLLHQVSAELDGLAMRTPQQGTGGQISMKGFTFGQEIMTQKVHQGNQISADIRDTIEQIVERAVTAEGKEESLASAISLSRLKLTGLHGRERIATQGSVDKKEGLLSPGKSKGQIHATNGEQKVVSLYPGGKDRLLSDLDAAQGMKGTAEEQGSGAPLKTKIGDILHYVSNTDFSETITTAKQNQKTLTGNLLPSYLVDQVGKQLARSALRGERVVRLQLKPPELGAVKVEMDMKGNILKLWMMAENSSVREVLLSNVHELRETLVDQGVKLERLDVQINYDANQSLAHSREGSGEEHKWIRDADGLVLPATEGGEDLLTGLGTLALSHHVLDLII